MNIFFLDYDPKKAAIYHCDRHVVKMITETSQMLSTVHHFFNSKHSILMKPCFVNHPCNKWLRESRSNYLWTKELLIYLLEEYDFRYENKNKFLKSREIVKLNSPEALANLSLTMPALAMPDDCKIFDNPVDCYREYYRKYKRKFATWKKREKPYWF